MVECPLCLMNLSILGLRQRDEHVNECLERGGDLSEHGDDELETKNEEIDLSKNQIKQEPETKPDFEPKELNDEDNEPSKDQKSPLKREEVRSPTQASIPPEPQEPEAAAREPRRKRKPPYYKILTLDTIQVAVDAFGYGDLGVTSYYLTHFHSDHYGGLSRSWKHGLIYCTPSTARLCEMKLGVSNEWLRPMAIDTIHIIDGQKVVFMDANHCPGAAVILFNDAVLHTGDFRASPALATHVKQYTQRLECLYLDTTYLDPARTFPEQSLVVDTCASYCRKIQNKVPAKSFFLAPKPVRILVIVGTYTIGKERLAVQIARALNSKIWAPAAKRNILDACDDAELHELLERENGLNCQVHLAPMRDITIAKLENQWNFLKKHFTSVVAFCPTGWTWSSRSPFDAKLMENRAIKRPFIQICKVPYSEHSSFNELKEFCRAVPSKEIIATVGSKYFDVLKEWECR